MNKKELQEKRKAIEKEGHSVTISFESSEDGYEATVKFDSTEPMTQESFLLAAVDWLQEFAADLYNDAKERQN